jgi:hypothetical protein
MKNALLMTLSAIIMASNFATVLGNDKSNPNTIITSQLQLLRRAQNKAGKNEAKVLERVPQPRQVSRAPVPLKSPLPLLFL